MKLLKVVSFLPSFFCDTYLRRVAVFFSLRFLLVHCWCRGTVSSIYSEEIEEVEIKVDGMN